CRSSRGSGNGDVGFRVRMTADVKTAGPSYASVPVPLAVPDGLTGRAPGGAPFRFLMLLCFGGVCAGSVALIVLLIVLLTRGTGPSDAAGMARPVPDRLPTSRYPVRLAEDGFWVGGLDCEAGSVGPYRCRVGGQPQRGQFTVVRPGAEQFVYTGGTPADVEVFDLVPPGTAIVDDSSPLTSGSGFDSSAAEADVVEEPSPPPFTG